MSKANLVIAGAEYFNENLNAILVPHFTGEFNLVDCSRYLPKKEIMEIYDKEFFKENKDNYIEFEGEKFYYAEYCVFSTEGLKLVSDISNLRFIS